eukprot:1180706-Prorocentrum_minimum.AAC.5
MSTEASPLDALNSCLSEAEKLLERSELERAAPLVKLCVNLYNLTFPPCAFAEQRTSAELFRDSVWAAQYQLALRWCQAAAFARSAS